MKLNDKILVTVVAMVGAAALAGCNKASDATQPENAPAAEQPTPAAIELSKPAPPAMPAAKDESVNASVRVSVGTQAPAPRYIYAPSAPPAPRFEHVGRPPSARHFWVKGHWSHTGREWIWVGGHWDTRRDGYVYVSPHWDVVHGHHRFIHGHWVRRRF